MKREHSLRWDGNVWLLVLSDCTVSYRPVLSSERAPYRKNNKAIVTKERIRIKSGHGPQRGARYQDELVDWPSAVDKLNSIIPLKRQLTLSGLCAVISQRWQNCWIMTGWYTLSETSLTLRHEMSGKSHGSWNFCVFSKICVRTRFDPTAYLKVGPSDYCYDHMT
jgi:hypothetical protein